MDDLRAVFSAYLRTLSRADWDRLTPFKIRSLQSYMSIKLNYDFLHAAVSCWDSSVNVFNFAGDEVCPLLEEFSAILALLVDCKVEMVIPVPGMYCLDRLATLFDISSVEVGFLLSDDQDHPELCGDRVLELCMGKTKSDPSWCVLMLLCALLFFFCVPEVPVCDFRLLTVIDQVIEGASPVAVILAETLIGLTRCSELSTPVLTGSPLLLQVWISEKLGIQEVPSISWSRYHPRNFSSRGLVLREFSSMSSVEWGLWLSDPHVLRIRWMCPWWRLTAVVLTCRGAHVPVCGLYEETFYHPSLLCRQYRVRQWIPSLGLFVQVKEFTIERVALLRSQWMSARFHVIDHSSATVDTTSREYRNWVLMWHSEISLVIRSVETKAMRLAERRLVD